MGRRRRALSVSSPASKKVKLADSEPSIPRTELSRTKGNKQRPQRTSRNILTRSKAALLRTQFAFFDLPGELRNMIYAYLLDFDGVSTVVNKHYDAHIEDEGYVPWPNLFTPAILLTSKQTYREALYVLHRKTLTIPHSTTPNADITDVVCRPLLKKLRKVDITRDLRHGESHIWCDLLEFFQLIKSAVGVWNEEHHLQELTIDLRADGVVSHLNVCPQSGHCYFLDEIKGLLEMVSTLRSVKKVTIGGFLAPHAKAALELVSLPPAYLLKVPGDIRRRIFGYVLDWNDADSALVRANRSVAGQDPEHLIRMAPPLTTPSLLLTNKMLSKEAAIFLKDRPLAISAPPPRSTAPGTKIDNFIAKSTLQQVQHLRLDIHSHESHNTLQDWKHLFSELAERLKFCRALRSLHINVMDGEWVRAAQESRSPEDWYGLGVLGNISSQRTVEKKLERVTWEGRVAESVMERLRTKLAATESTDDDLSDGSRIVKEL